MYITDLGVYSALDCQTDTEVYVPPTRPLHPFWDKEPSSSLLHGDNDDNDNLCLCEQVRIGRCEYAPGRYHCAVSAQACRVPSTFVPPYTTNNNRNQSLNPPECRLCPPRPMSHYVRPPSTGPSPTTSSTTNNKNTTSIDWEWDADLILGLVVAVAVGLLVSGTVYGVVRGVPYCMRWICQHHSRPSKRETPASSIVELTEREEDDDDENSVHPDVEEDDTRTATHEVV